MKGQDIEPRRWTPLPLGMKVIGVGYGSTSGDVLFDPVLKAENVKVDVETFGLSYIQSFELLGHLSRVDVTFQNQSAVWDGLLEGEPARVERDGMADPRIRLSVTLLGAPPADAKSLRSYFARKTSNTVVGAGLAVTLPWGEYIDDKLLNLGQNRYSFRPQLGVVHTRGPWSFELTGSSFLYTDNGSFLVDQFREQEPVYALQSHVIRILKPGMWASLSVGYGRGGSTWIDGVSLDDERSDFLSAFTFGFPISKTQGLKLSYVWGSTRKSIGNDVGTLVAVWSMRL